MPVHLSVNILVLSILAILDERCQMILMNTNCIDLLDYFIQFSQQYCTEIAVWLQK